MDSDNAVVTNKIRVFKVECSEYKGSYGYGRTLVELEYLLEAMLGSSGEHEDFPDSMKIEITFDYMTIEDFNNLGDWEF